MAVSGSGSESGSENGIENGVNGRLNPTLQPALRWYHIFMIAIGGVIGLSFGTESGQILGIAGYGGTLIAYGVNGLVAICVMEGLCEMVVHWPISNAMIEFVRAFVDEDLAIVVGIAYWYTMVATYVGLLIGAGQLLKLWGLSPGLIAVVIVVVMLSIILINCFNILLFGNVELVGGILKVIFLFMFFVVMLCINTGGIGDHAIGASFFNDNVKNNPEVASSKFVAVILVIPIATISYIGVEIVAVTAFEAVNPSELQWPAKNIAWVASLLYLVTIGTIAANVEWFNQNLPKLLSQPLVDITSGVDLGHTPVFNETGFPVTSIPIVAAWQVHAKNIATFLTCMLVYSGLSSANVALYVASRTLYGLTRSLDTQDGRWYVRMFAYFGLVTSRTRIPIWSLLISALIFGSWMPYVNFSTGFSQDELQQVFFSIGGSGGLLVWASQCLAFIRYYKWLGMHRRKLNEPSLARFQRWPQIGFSSWASSLQPVPAYFGLFSCLLIVFVLNSAGLWNGKEMLYKTLTVYLGPLILIIIFCILKLANKGRGWVRLDQDHTILFETLKDLDRLVNPDRIVSHDRNIPLGPMNPARSSTPGSPRRPASPPPRLDDGFPDDITGDT